MRLDSDLSVAYSLGVLLDSIPRFTICYDVDQDLVVGERIIVGSNSHDLGYGATSFSSAT